MSSDIPSGKLNRWCERQGLHSSDGARLTKALQHLNRELSDYENAALFIHELFGCEGLEFVAFSSARFDKSLTLPRDITLVPCFLSREEMKSWNDPLVRLTFTMQDHARFIYDGWVPISDWSFENVRKVIRDINEILTLFAAQERTWFTWEPKYFPRQLYPSSQNVEDRHVQEISDLNSYVQTWNSKDLNAFYRSLAWLSQSLVLPQPAARFLFCIVSIESLATYIECDASNDSIFSKLKTTSANTNNDKEDCIRTILDSLYSDSPVQAIRQAYFDCVVPITKMLKSHLSMIFADDSKSFELMFEGDKGESLYEIRHKIAHGTLDALSDFERQKIDSRV